MAGRTGNLVEAQRVRGAREEHPVPLVRLDEVEDVVARHGAEELVRRLDLIAPLLVRERSESVDVIRHERPHAQPQRVRIEERVARVDDPGTLGGGWG